MSSVSAHLLGVIVFVVSLVEASSAELSNTTCDEGLIVPLWTPTTGLRVGDKIARAFVYFILMVWLFIGVSIIADRFMGAIEMITSQEKEVKIKKSNGEEQIIVVQVWNETVANLTLMALGSSAPEILLSVIEMFAKKFQAGDLGPGTIVGSAAFNLFVIIGICVYVIPEGEVRYIKHLRVFFVTAFFSVFAYIWLYLILAIISPGEVFFWEAFLTFLFFPLTVIWAYIADRRLLVYKLISKEYRMNRRGVIVEMEAMDVEGGQKDKGLVFDEAVDESVREFEEHRKEYMTVIRELRIKYPNITMESLESMAREEIINRGPKSRAFYRIQATRKLTGGSNIMKKIREEAKQEKVEEIEEKKDDDTVRIFFDPGHYTVMENVGTFEVTVVREGDLHSTVMVDYKTEDGTANAGGDYESAEGTLVFASGETSKTFSISVLDDDIFEEDEHFYARLSNLRFGTQDGLAVTHAFNGSAGQQQQTKPPRLELAAPFVATIMILDDDHGGIFNVAEKDVEVVESIGTYELKIVRWSGARGRVAVPYKTEDGTAKAGKDYLACEGEIIFENNESEQIIEVPILEEDSYEKDVLFYLDIGEPVAQGGFEFEKKDDMTEEEKIALLGKPKLGNNTRCQIRIKENKDYKNLVDKLVKRANASLVVGSSTWREQFTEALTVSAGGDDDDDEEGSGDDEEKLPSCGDYVMHFVTVFWKLLFAFVPPTGLLYGYPTFIISILGVGVLTGVIGDLASYFGCTIGVPDTITAIAFVALGTSVPDTFASKVAAQQDPYADASVGNVTGSNGVNVFLGIGIAWTMATVYHYFNNTTFYVNPGNLAFSVTLFCIEAIIAIGVMMIRRHPSIGGELGGPRIPKIITSYFLISLWLFYVFMSTLEAYKLLPGLA